MASAASPEIEAALAEQRRIRKLRQIRRQLRVLQSERRHITRALDRLAKEQARRDKAKERAARAPVPLPELTDHQSALERQILGGWGWGADRNHNVHVPLPDWANWQRIRLFGIEHLTAFRYTNDHHTLTAVFTVETKSELPSSLSCMEEFERKGLLEIERYGVRIGDIRAEAGVWDEKPVVTHRTEGRAPFLVVNYDFSVAWTAYPAYEHGCLVYATVVLWEGHPELARKVLDRFVAEGVAQVRPLTPSLPK